MTGNTGSRTIFNTNPYLELNNQGQILHLELTQSLHKLGRDGSQVDLVVPDDWQVISRCQALLRRLGEEYQIYDGDGTKPSTNGLFVNRTRITPEAGYLLSNGSELHIGQNPQTLILLKYCNPANPGLTVLPSRRCISLKNQSVLLGRDDRATLTLPAPTVSRRHAIIDTDQQGQYILHDYSTNGVFVNGQRVTGTARLTSGETIRIGPFVLVLQGDELHILDQGNQIRLEAKNLLIRNRLDDISLAIEPGQFVALVGGSGTGKSTLMRTLLGIEPVIQGAVYLNGEHLRNNFSIYRSLIGYVPQEDIIHRELTVAEVLTYAAKLRLPPDIEVEQVIDKTLAAVKMSHCRNSLVSSLSGGERKRVSIAVELLADPKLFFLDEPTSGLDPGLDKKMMQLLRELAQQGRTVILVTHATANIRLCDRLAFLGKGGRLCYFGPPDAALNFFKVLNQDFAEIYNSLEQPEDVIQWVHKFRHDPSYEKYINQSLTPGTNSQHLIKPNNNRQARVSFLRQLLLLSQRYFQIVRRDYLNLALALFTAPIAIGLITLAMPTDKTPLVASSAIDPLLAPLALRVLFIFTSAALWVGLSSSVQEIIKESAIYQRERIVNLNLFAYLGSKFAILAGLAVLQTLLIVIVILLGFQSPQPKLIPWNWGLGITTFLTLIASSSLGLLVSTVVKNSSQANSALPLLLLPQIIYSGVLFKLDGIPSKIISWLMISRWSIGAYGTLVNVNAMAPTPFQLPDGRTLPQVFEPTPVYNFTWVNLGLNWGILCLQAIFYLGLALWQQKRKDLF